MTARSIACRFLLGVAASSPLCAQVPPMERDTSAAHLNDQGRFAEAIRAIGALLAGGGRYDGAVVGIAWNIRGVALQNLGDWEGARRSYEAAIAILRSEPNQIGQYASAVDNLGSLKAENGQLEESRLLRLHARQLYQSVNDHAGVARASAELALVALWRRDRKHARQLLSEAIREESLVPDPDVGDVAALDDAQALAYVQDHRTTDALNAINRAIGLWADHYGPRYYLLADGLFCRAQINQALHKHDDAKADFRRSLDILRINNDIDSQVYFIIERAYAVVLRDRGERHEADRLISDAKKGLEGLGDKQCGGCSISVESFRY